MRRISYVLAVSALALLLAGCDREKDGSIFGGNRDTKVAHTAYPENVYFGDTHLHTSNSSDAFAFGVRLGPELAYVAISGLSAPAEPAG